jgi:glutamate synthase domain-containing protein 1
MKPEDRRALLDSRSDLTVGVTGVCASDSAEGGCGVIGLASDQPIAGRHMLTASRQMHNRGNGKGGGIAAAGLDPGQMGVSPDVLRTHYLLQIAYLDDGARRAVERECIDGRLDVTHAYQVESVEDYRSIPGLEVPPPTLVRYFCRVSPEILAEFAERNALRHLPGRAVEDEYIYQNTFRLNQRFYTSLGNKRAFVTSHGRDMLVAKIVGYAEQAVEYYRMDEMTAHVWIAHQRYPTKGRVWHPGGAHPFVGMNEALVHNGDFANYHRVTEYLRQRNISPLFLTDTEVSVLLFDLWDRIYGYPLEVVIEALAPTTERDFTQLPPEKQELYRAIQQTHLQGSPDGPWFFIVARSRPDDGRWQLLGITDTSMLRPQVFALSSSQGEDPVSIGLIASERQAINACLKSLSAEDPRFQPVADRYWNARGGSYNDGGAFVFTVARDDAGSEDGSTRLTCHDKFGNEVCATPGPAPDAAATEPIPAPAALPPLEAGQSPEDWLGRSLPALTSAPLEDISTWCRLLLRDSVPQPAGSGRLPIKTALQALTLLRNRRFDPGAKRRSALLAIVDRALFALLRSVPALPDPDPGPLRLVAHSTAETLRPPLAGESGLVIDGAGFEPEGEDSAARLLVRAHALGWRHFILLDLHGGRFAGCGLGPDTPDVRIELIGDAGDYIASGMDGAELVVHGDAQDQVGQILKSGKLVIHGDVGQTFLYGAKGGRVFVLGSAAGRPLINAVGRPKVVINGTCLDYLAESFMAGDPLDGGGFAILNGVSFDDHGNLAELPTPYPGGNLFSLASGGAIYLRDPALRVDETQLNGGRFAPLSPADWDLVHPCLVENERLFGITVSRLLSFQGQALAPDAVYRKVEVDRQHVLR